MPLASLFIIYLYCIDYYYYFYSVVFSAQQTEFSGQY